VTALTARRPPITGLGFVGTLQYIEHASEAGRQPIR
jgi:hypothetical protein